MKPVLAAKLKVLGMKPCMATVVGTVAILFPFAVVAASLAEKFQPGMPYYFDSFDPAMKPWDPGQDLNIEEVFKNHTYYEIVFDKSVSEFTVKRYIQNRKERGDKYLVKPDGSIEKK